MVVSFSFYAFRQNVVERCFLRVLLNTYLVDIKVRIIIRWHWARCSFTQQLVSCPSSPLISHQTKLCESHYNRSFKVFHVETDESNRSEILDITDFSVILLNRNFKSIPYLVRMTACLYSIDDIFIRF